MTHVQGETESLFDLLRYPCTHDAWFKRSFHPPDAWRGQRVWLHVGGVLPAAEFWINGHGLGTTRSSRCALRGEITPWLRWGESNTIAIRVFRTGDGLDGMHELYGWSGIYRSCWIEAVPSAHVVGLQVLTSLDPPAARLRLAIALPGGTAGCTVEARIMNAAARQEFRAGGACRPAAAGAELELNIPMPGALPWSPETPNLYRVAVSLTFAGAVADTASLRFGLRALAVRGRQILLNGAPIFLRGGCDDQLYPRTLCPPADKEFFRDRIRRAKAYGFNYTKSCVDIFPREFLEAADELGYLVCQEMPFGLSFARSRRYNPPAAFADLCRRELAHIIRFERHHPCIISYSMASELDARWLHSRRTFRLFSRDLPRRARGLHPGALIFDCTGEGAQWRNYDGASAARAKRGTDRATPVCTPLGRRATDLQSSVLAGYNEGFCPLNAPYSSFRNVTLPFILHEYSWITGLSDPGLIRRCRGLPIRAWQVPEMIAAARGNGQGRVLSRLVACSRRLKLALRKDALEQARRAPQVAGYHHWLIHDFPFCAEGVFNEFWEYPRDLPPARFRMSNADTVLLLEDGNRRAFTWGGRMPLAIGVAHHGRQPLRRAEVQWRLEAGRHRLASGVARLRADIPGGSLVKTPDLELTLPPGNSPALLIISAVLVAGGRMLNRNEWNLWAFPAAAPARRWDDVATDLSWAARLLPGSRRVTAPAHAGARVIVVGALDDDLVDYLAGGGRVLLAAPGRPEGGPGLLPRGQGRPAYRTVEFNAGRHGNMGTVIRPHPALGRLPHSGWCDFCFVPLIQWAYPFALRPFGRGRINPIIRSIGHMATMEDKAYLFDVAVGRGRLLACSLNLNAGVRGDPLARHLVFSLLAWLRTAARVSAVPVAPRRLAAVIRQYSGLAGFRRS